MFYFFLENVIIVAPQLNSYQSVSNIPSPTDSRDSRNSQSKILDSNSLKSMQSSKSMHSLKSSNRITPMSIPYTPSFIKTPTLNEIKLMTERSIIELPNVDEIIMPVLPSSLNTLNDYNG